MTSYYNLQKDVRLFPKRSTFLETHVIFKLPFLQAATESPLRMMKKVFYFGHVEKRLD